MRKNMENSLQKSLHFPWSWVSFYLGIGSVQRVKFSPWTVLFDTSALNIVNLFILYLHSSANSRTTPSTRLYADCCKMNRSPYMPWMLFTNSSIEGAHLFFPSGRRWEDRLYRPSVQLQTNPQFYTILKIICFGLRFWSSVLFQRYAFKQSSRGLYTSLFPGRSEDGVLDSKPTCFSLLYRIGWISRLRAR